MATSALGYQSFFQAQLTAAITATDLTIPLDVVPTPSEGFLVIESTSSTKREIIYYTSKTSVSVVCPASGRGYDGTTAQTHTSSSIVIMAPVASMFSTMRDLFETTPQGWTPVTQTVSSVAYSGNRSYTLTMSADVSATLSPGMRVRTTRTVTAPTQCTSLNGTTQYYSRASASITGMTFTNNFVVSAWVKLSSYTNSIIVSRRDGTQGWQLEVTASGQIKLSGFSGGLANTRSFTSYQSIPLNKWVHVTAQLDMTVTTNTPTTNYIMIDGVDVPSSSATGGTSPTSLVQAGNLEIGSVSGGAFFPGKIAQVAIYNAKVTQANIRLTYSQGLLGTETSLISAYSFNGVITDLNTTNANNLTANGSAVATNADSCFSVNSSGTPSGTTDFGLVMSVATTTVVVQVPEANTIPTSGGVSALSYSTQQAPYGYTLDKNRWTILVLVLSSVNTSGTTVATVYNPGGLNISVPVGSWSLSNEFCIVVGPNASTLDMSSALSTSSSSFTLTRFESRTIVNQTNSSNVHILTHNRSEAISLTTTTPYYFLLYSVAPFTVAQIGGTITSLPHITSCVLAVPAGI